MLLNTDKQITFKKMLLHFVPSSYNLCMEKIL